MQLCGGVATLANFFSSSFSQQDMASDKTAGELVLSGENEYVLSEDENVIIFVLDNFPNHTFDEVLSKVNPDIIDEYSDFTRFDNCNMEYKGTFPGDLHLLTGYDYDFAQEVETNFTNVWQADLTKGIYGSLEEAGYDINVYMSSPSYICGAKMERIADVFSNIVSENSKKISVSRELINKFIRLSLYRYVPMH